MSRLRSVRGAAIDLARDRVLPAVVIDVVRDRCSVRLSQNAQVMRGLPYSGGAPVIGDRVMVSYSTGAPVVLAMGRSGAAAEVKRAIRSRSIAVDIPRGQLGGSGGGYIPEHGHSAVTLYDSSAGSYVYFPATDQGLLDALAAADSGDTVIIPEAIIGDGTLTFTVPDNCSLRGRDRFTSIIQGSVVFGPECEIQNLLVSLVATSSDPIFGLKKTGTTGALISEVQVVVNNQGSGDAYAIQVEGGADSWLGARNTYCRAAATSGDARIVYSSAPTENAGVDLHYCTLANTSTLTDAPAANWDLSENVVVGIYSCSWHDGYWPEPGTYELRNGDRESASISFLALLDTPDTFVGSELQYVQVNGDGDALVFSSPNHQALFTVEGALSVGSGSIRIPNHAGRTLNIIGVYLDVSTPPTGAAIIGDIHLDGTTIFTNQAHRPQIAAGANSGNTTDIDVSAWADGSYLTMGVDQIGSTVAGSDLTATVVYY